MAYPVLKQTDIELKPCPFCNGEAHMFGFKKTVKQTLKGIGVPYAFVRCELCGCSSPVSEDDVAAARTWNRRWTPHWSEK